MWPGLPVGYGRAAGDHHQDVVLDQPPGECDVAVVLLDLGVVAAHHPHRAPDLPLGDRFDQRLRGPSQGLEDGFHREAAHHVHRLVRDPHPLRDAVGVVLHRGADQLVADLHASLGVEGDVGGAGELGLVRGGDDFGVEALGHVGHGGHDALVVHYHHLQGPGHDHQLLHQVIAGHVDAAPHEQLVAGAAQAHQVDAPGAFLPGQLEQAGVLGGPHHHVGQQRVVPVEGDVDLIGPQHAQVDFRADWASGCRRGRRRARWLSWSRPSRRKGWCAANGAGC